MNDLNGTETGYCMNEDKQTDSETATGGLNQILVDDSLEILNASETPTEDQNDVGTSSKIQNEVIDSEMTDIIFQDGLANTVTETNNIENEVIDEESNPTEDKSSEPNALVQRATRLPISRVRSIMKFDDDVHAASQEAIFLVTKATESFIEDFVKEAYQCTLASKKKTVSKRDVDTAIFSHDYFMFLDGALD